MNKKERVIRKPEILARVGVSHPTIWRWEKTGYFPKRVSLGGQACGWFESEIDAWFAARAAERE